MPLVQLAESNEKMAYRIKVRSAVKTTKSVTVPVRHLPARACRRLLATQIDFSAWPRVGTGRRVSSAGMLCRKADQVQACRVAHSRASVGMLCRSQQIKSSSLGMLCHTWADAHSANSTCYERLIQSWPAARRHKAQLLLQPILPCARVSFSSARVRVCVCMCKSTSLV